MCLPRGLVYTARPSFCLMRGEYSILTARLVAQHGLTARQCQLLKASTEGHQTLNVRMRLEDVALERSNFFDSERNDARVYSVLVSTGNSSVRLMLRTHDEMTVQLPVLVAGRRALVDVTFSVQRVRAVVAGLRSSELMHRAIVTLAATSD